MSDSPDLLFWDVDTQVDFMEPGGKLYVPGAEQIVDRVRRLNAWAEAQGVLVVSSVDAHQSGDREFDQYRLHCLVGTRGQQKVGGTVLDSVAVLPNRKVSLPPMGSVRQFILEKQSLDVFTNPNADVLLRQIAGNKGGIRVVVYGVVTELCVRIAALGLSDRGCRVDVVRDAVRSLDAKEAERFLAEVEGRGGRLLSTADIIGGSVEELSAA